MTRGPLTGIKQGDSFEELETEEPALTGEDLSQVDDTLLDLELEDSGTSAPLTGISPLTSLPASLPAQNVPATSFTMGPVQQSTTDSSALFRAPHPLSQTVTQDIPPSGYIPHTTPGRQSVAERMAALSFPQPQRAVSRMEIPQTPRTQLIRSQLEQQNFEMMNSLQQKNQQKIKDLSAQLQTGLQAFLQQSMEQMFTRLAPAQTQPPAATSTAPPPHIVSITPVSAIPPAKAEEPMDLAPSQPALPEVKKGLSKVKGSSAIAQQSIQAVVSQVKVPTATPSTQSSSLSTAASAPRLASPLQALEQEEYGTDASASSFSSASKPEDPTEVGEQVAPPNLPFRELVQKVREFLSIPDPAAEEDYKLGSALGHDPLLLQQEKLDRPPSIKLPMAADLSCLQTAQDDSVKPSTSNTLGIGTFPGIPPHKGSWYSVVDNKFAQTPQVVPQAFSNIAKPGYRSGPPASVQQKDLVKLKYMTRENISIANFLSTFGMASESCLNNLRLSRDQRERLFDGFRATMDGPTREQIMLQLFTMTQQESAQM